MKRKLPLTFEEFKSIYSKVPRLCVDLVVQQEGQVLLTLRKKNGFKDLWHLPGSTLYYREKITDCIDRVAKEELGVSVKVKKFLGYLEYFSELKERGFGYSVSLVFLCTANETNFILDDQVETAEFFAQIPENTVVEQKEFLQKLGKLTRL